MNSFEIRLTSFSSLATDDCLPPSHLGKVKACFPFTLGLASVRHSSNKFGSALTALSVAGCRTIPQKPLSEGFLKRVVTAATDLQNYYSRQEAVAGGNLFHHCSIRLLFTVNPLRVFSIVATRHSRCKHRSALTAPIVHYSLFTIH